MKHSTRSALAAIRPAKFAERCRKAYIYPTSML